jgi:hypothetical protein
MKSNLTKAFAALRKAGYFAKQNFWCCQTCGWAAVPDEQAEKAVFYHNQDNDRKKEGKPFMLAWSGDGNQICKILNDNGIKTNWSGDEDNRIEVISW